MNTENPRVNSATKTKWDELTIAIPAYSRPRELIDLLESALSLAEAPGEILICEDCSAERNEIRSIAEWFSSAFEAGGTTLRYHENERNLGYDANIRELLKLAGKPWVMLIGNDDLLLSCAVTMARCGIEKFPNVDMFSCAYLKFTGSLENTIGCTSLSATDAIFTPRNSDSGAIVRMSGFVGGLLFRKSLADKVATECFDGTLYYQMYLAAHAYSTSGIAYLSTPMVASRVNNPPLFGSAATEKGKHKPGIYAATGRASMWIGILAICKHVEEIHNVPLCGGVRTELARGQAFHVYEKLSEQGRTAVWVFTKQISPQGVIRSWRIVALVIVCLSLGKKSGIIFSALRQMQKTQYKFRLRYAARKN